LIELLGTILRVWELLFLIFLSERTLTVPLPEGKKQPTELARSRRITLALIVLNQKICVDRP
jgi:hypothetical protein